MFSIYVSCYYHLCFTSYDKKILESIPYAAEAGCDVICVALDPFLARRLHETPFSQETALKIGDKNFRITQADCVACFWDSDALRLKQRANLDEDEGMAALAVTF